MERLKVANVACKKQKQKTNIYNTQKISLMQMIVDDHTFITYAIVSIGIMFSSPNIMLTYIGANFSNLYLNQKNKKKKSYH